MVLPNDQNTYDSRWTVVFLELAVITGYCCCFYTIFCTLSQKYLATDNLTVKKTIFENVVYENAMASNWP